jgi:hypothetical protein
MNPKMAAATIATAAALLAPAGAPSTPRPWSGNPQSSKEEK